MSEAAKVKLVWNGSQAVNLDVACETGNGVLENGREIAVSEELADHLLSSSSHWAKSKAPKAKPAASTDGANTGAEEN